MAFSPRRQLLNYPSPPIEIGGWNGGNLLKQVRNAARNPLQRVYRVSGVGFIRRRGQAE